MGWLYDKKSLRKTVVRGLFFEIDNHIFLDLDQDKGGQPNMVLVSFNSHFFSENVSTIYRLMDSAILKKISFYYAKSDLALFFQQKIEELNLAIKKIGPITEMTSSGKEMEKNSLVQERGGYRDLLRRTIVPLENMRLQLLEEFGKVFPKRQNPSEFACLKVSPQYESWWKGVVSKVSDDSPSDT